MTERRTAIALVGYVLLALVAFGWALFLGRWNLLVHPRPLIVLEPWLGVVLSLLAGGVLAFGVVRGTRWLVLHARWAEVLHLEFRSILVPVSSRQIALLACGSGIAEELFFRGAMQPVVGLALTTLLFGVAHFAPFRTLWIWTLSAALIGLALGLIYELTGSLLGAIAAHIVINYENMHFIECFDPLPPDRLASSAERSIPIPQLVGSERPRPKAAGGRAVDGGQP